MEFVPEFDPLHEVKVAALKIIDEHISLEELYTEIQEDSSAFQLSCNVPVVLTKSSIVEYVSAYSTLAGVDLDQAAKNVLYQHLHHLTATAFTAYLSSHQREFFASLLEATRSSIQERCSIHSLKDLQLTSLWSELQILNLLTYNHLQHCLPVDVFHALNKCEILDLETFVKLIVQQKHVLKEFVQGLIECSSQEDAALLDVASEVICQLMKPLGQPSSQAMQKVCQYILHTTFKRLLEQQADSKPTSKKSHPEKFNIFKLLSDTAMPDLLKTFFTQLLVVWITTDPVLNVSDAIQQQDSWKSCKLPEVLIETHKHIFTIIGLNEVIKVVQKTLAKRQVNWKHLLCMISCLLLAFEEASRQVDAMNFSHKLGDQSFLSADLIKDEIRKGLEKSSVDNLVIGLLIARQATLEGGHVFSSYSSWFQETFGAGATCLLRSPPAYRFFVRFLSDLVPGEQYQFLKVQIMKPPHPTNQACREILSDYLALARTRLQDLKPTVSQRADELTSDQNEDSRKQSSNEELNDQLRVALQEVENIVRIFEKTTRVPSSVMEMSIFRKAHYQEKFLPALLQPRPLPDVSDSKMQLIASLLSIGKIPRSTYAKYQAQCKHETEKLLQDVMEVDAADGFETFDSILERFKSSVKMLCSKPHKQDKILQQIHRCLCDVTSSERVTDDAVTGGEPVDLSGSHVLDPSLAKIVDCVMDSLADPLTTLTNHSVLQKLMCVIGNQSSVKDALCRKICTLILFQDTADENSIMRSISVILLGTMLSSGWMVCIYSGRSSSTLIDRQVMGVSSVKRQNCRTDPLLDAVIQALPMTRDAATFLKTTDLQCRLVETLLSFTDLPPDHVPRIFSAIFWNLCFADSRLRKTCHGGTTTTKKKKLKLENPTDESLKLAGQIDSLLPRLHTACHRLERILNIERATFMPIKEFVTREVFMNSSDDVIGMNEKSALYAEALFNEQFIIRDLDDVIEFLFDHCELFEVSSKTKTIHPFIEFCCRNLTSLLGTESSSKWFVDFLDARKARIERKVSGIALEKKLLRLATTSVDFLLLLPPHFMFSNIRDFLPSQAPNATDRVVESLRSYVNFYFRHVFWEKSQQRPFSSTSLLTCRLMREFAEQLLNAFDLTTIDYIAANLPLLLVSLLTSWSSVSHFRLLCRKRYRRVHESLCQLRSIATLDVRDCSDACERNLRDLKFAGSIPWKALSVSMAIHVIDAEDLETTRVAECLALMSRVQPKTYWYFLRSLITCSASPRASAAVFGEKTAISKVFELILANLPLHDLLICLTEVDEESRLIFSDSTIVRSSLSAVRLLSNARLAPELFHCKDFLPLVVKLHRDSRDQAMDSDLTCWHQFLTDVSRKSPTISLKQAAQLTGLSDATSSIIAAELSRR